MKIIFGLLIWIVSILLFVIPLGILRIYKVLLDTVTTRLNNEDEEWYPLSVNDAVIAPDASWIKSDVNAGSVLKLKGNYQGEYFNLEDLRDQFSRCFLREDLKGGKYDKLSSYIANRGGYTYRVQKHFIDLSEHILEINWNTNCSGQYKNLGDFLTAWLAQKWGEKKPCWEMILIQGVPEEEDQIILAFKIHHALADGYSLLHILDVLTDNTSPYLVRDFEGETKVPKIIEGIKSAVYLHRMNGYSPKENPFRVNLTESNYYESIFTFTRFPLDDIKKIRRRWGVHFSSVIFAILVGALRRYVAGADLETKRIPRKIGLMTSLPWPGHPSRNPKNRNVAKLCNHWTCGAARVSLDEKDPILRMKQIESGMENFKNLGLHKFLNRVMIPVLSTLPSSPLNKLFSIDKGYTIGLSSAVGRDNYSLMGCKVEQIFPIGSGQDLMPYVPVCCFTLSHSGVMDMTIKFHPSVIKDQQTVDMISQEFCVEEFNALLKASQSPSQMICGGATAITV